MDSIGREELASQNHNTINLIDQLLLKQTRIIEQEQEICSLKEELEHFRSQFVALYDFNSSALITIDKNYQIHSGNFQGASLLNYKCNELINKNFLDFIDPFYQTIFVQCVQQALEKKKRSMCEIEVFQKNGARQYIKN